MNLDDMFATIADLKEKATPPQYVLCGRERYKSLMRESGVDPDTPEGEHTLNEARRRLPLRVRAATSSRRLPTSDSASW
jgi:hypothetical protein